MNKYIAYLLILGTLIFTMSACDNGDKENIPAGTTVAFATSVLKTMENVTPLQIPVTLNYPAPQDVKVVVAVKSEEGAVENVHYHFQSKEITIAKGASIGYFFVDVTDDREINPDRIFTIELKETVGATVMGDGKTCRIIIQSDEGLPVVGFQSTLISAPEEEALLEIPVVLNKPYNQPVSFRLEVLEGGTAVRNEHFSVKTDQVYTIPAGDTLLHVHVQIVDNDTVNDDMVFTLRMTEVTNAVISEVYQESKVTIINDERDAYVSFSQTAKEVFESDGYVWLPVKVSGVYKLPITVKVKVEDGSALSGSDYVLEKDEILFSDNVIEDSLRIKIINNDVVNVDKNFKVIISQVTGALRADKDTIMTVTILNDEINKKTLYDDILGNYNFTENNGASGVVTVYAGDNLGEENANYMKRVKCKGNIASGWEIRWVMDFDPETGLLSVPMQQLVAQHIPFGVLDDGKDYSDADIRLWYATGAGEAEGMDPTVTTISTSWNKNCTVCSWHAPNGGTIQGGINLPGSVVVPGYAWFIFDEVVMTRVK